MTEINKVAWLYLKEKKLLCARSKGKDTWYVPGGKKEPGESDQAALIREIKEELSVCLKPETVALAEIFRSQAHGKPDGTIVRIACYTADFSGNIQAESEIEETGWLRYSDRENCSQAVKGIMDWLKSKDLIE